jgi:hypothetical protein
VISEDRINSFLPLIERENDPRHERPLARICFYAGIPDAIQVAFFAFCYVRQEVGANVGVNATMWFIAGRSDHWHAEMQRRFASRTTGN